MVTVPVSQADGPRKVIATPLELKTSKYDSPNIQAALEALHQDGFVVLKSVVDVTHVDHINSFMTKEADELVRTEKKPYNQGTACGRATSILWRYANVL